MSYIVSKASLCYTGATGIKGEKPWNPRLKRPSLSFLSWRLLPWWRRICLVLGNLSWFWFLVNNKIGRALGAAFLAFLAIITFGQVKKYEGQKEAERDAMEDAFDRVEKGRDALRDGRDKPRDQRVRENDGRW